MKTVFISYKIPDSVKSMLLRMGFSLIFLPPEPSLPKPVSSHADMLIFGNVIQKDYYTRHSELFSQYDMVLAEESFGDKYPTDILLNAFSIRDTLFGRIESLSKKVRQLYPEAVNLRQGYAKCSTLLFGDNAITADQGIATALSEFGCDVLLIRPGHILLPGYDYGFIGGASFVYDNKIIFFGNITDHPDYIKIKAFTEQRGYEIIYDPDLSLTDFGGAVIYNK